MELKDLLKGAYKEGMTVEEINQALADITLDDKTDEITHLKDLLSKANSEASKYKKELNSKLSEQELADKEAKERMLELEANYNALLREKDIAKNKADLIALGYEEKLAEDTATALLDGDLKKVIGNQKKFIDGYTQMVKDELIKKTPRPNGGNEPKSYTVEDIMKVKDATERQNLIAEHMDLFE